jgi:putative transposase
MPKIIDFTLTNEEVKALEEAIKTDKRSGVSRRATAVRLLHLGKKVPEVAETVSASKPSIYNWHARFKADGVEGLVNEEKDIPKRKVTPAYLTALEAALAEEPEAFGYDFAIWTRERLLKHLERETGIRISLSWLAVIMEEQGYVYRRPKHDVSHRQDKEAKAAAQSELEVLKKTSSETISSSSLWTKQP